MRASRNSSQNARPFSRSISPDLEPLDAFSRRLSQRRQALPGAVLLLGLGGRRRTAASTRSRRSPRATASPSSRRPPRSRSSTPPRSCTTTSSTTPTPAAARPSAHRRSRDCTRDSGWAGSAGDFGRAAAILLGDLLLGWSDELFDEGLAALPDRDAARAARAEFVRMRTEVTVGQYLDILEERAWLTAARRRPAARARERVIVYKSARYSVEPPLAIGGARGRDRRAARRAARRSGCRSASRSSCATTCSASSATPRSPASRAATTCARASARCSSRSRANASPPAAPPGRRAARRPRPRRRADRDAAADDQRDAAPSTRSSGSSPTTSRRRPTALADAPLSRDGARRARRAGDDRSPAASS